MSISGLTALSLFTDKAPASPAYFNAKWAEVQANFDRIASVAASSISSLGWFNVKEYGAAGDGATDDAAAIRSAIAAAGAGGTVYFPAGTYRVDSVLTATGNGQTWLGGGYLGTTITKFHTGTGVAVTAVGFKASGLAVSAATAASATYAQGSGIRFAANSDFPALDRCHINGIDACLDFDGDGGKYFHGVNLALDPYTQTAGSEGRSVYLRGPDSNAMHRRFVNCVGQGIVDFGIIFDTLIANSIFRRPVWSSTTASITLIDNCVWGSLGQAVTISGENTVVTSSRFAGNVTLAASLSGSCVFAENIQTAGTFTDSSPVNTCIVRHHPLNVNYQLLEKHKVMTGSTSGGVVRSYRQISAGDSNYSWAPEAGVSLVRYATTVTSVRTVSLSTINVEDGHGVRITRTASGAPNVIVTSGIGGSSIATLAAGTWVDCEYNGSGFQKTAEGTLT